MRFKILVLISILFSLNVFGEVIKLPPMPGPENDKTLLGIDSNKNQVRDDMEILIYNKLSKEPAIFKAYLKQLQSHYLSLKNLDNSAELNKYNEQYIDDNLCVKGLRKLTLQQSIDSDFLISNALINTELRRKAENEIGARTTLKVRSNSIVRTDLCR